MLVTAPIARAQHPWRCMAFPGDTAGTAHPQVDESHMGHAARPVPVPAPAWQAGRRAAPLPPIPSPHLVPPRSKASCPRYRWGGHGQAMGQTPCPALGSSCPHKGPCRRDQGRKPLFLTVVFVPAQGKMPPGEETSPWDTHRGKGIVEVLADARKISQQGCPTPRPPFPAQEAAGLSPGRGWRGLVALSQVTAWTGYLAAPCHQAWHLLPAWAMLPRL